MYIISFLLLISLHVVSIPHVVEMYHVVVHVRIRQETLLKVKFGHVNSLYVM